MSQSFRLIGIFIALLICSLAITVQAQIVEIGEGETAEKILLESRAFPYVKSDETWPQGAMEAYANAFEYEHGIDVPPGHWVGVDIISVADEPQMMRLVTKAHILQTTGDAYLVREDGKVELLVIESLDANQKSRPRHVDHRMTISPPFSLGAGERATILVDARQPFGKGTNLSLMDETTFQASDVAQTVWYSVYAGFALAMCIAFLTLAVILNFKAAAWYATFLFTALIANMNSLGFMMAYLFPWNVGLSNNLNIALAALVALVYLVFINAFTDSRRNAPAFHKASWGFVLLAIALPIVNLILPRAAALLQIILVPYFIGLVAAAVWIARNKRIAGWGLFALGSVLWVLPLPLQTSVTVVSTNLGYYEVGLAILPLHVVDSLIFGAAIAIRALDLRRTRDMARAAEKAALERQQQEEQSRLLAEHNRDRARAKLAATHHDLRQPLTSLRLAMEKVSREDEGAAEVMRSGLDYITDILAPDVAEALPEVAERRDGETDSADRGETVAVQTLFENLERMFSAEAVAKGLRLVVEPSDLSVRTHVVSLIRSLSNLLSNAVRYTENGTITLSAEADAETVDFIVTDTGPGMDADTLERVQRRGERSSDLQGGEGLGLDIVSELARLMGGRMRAASSPGEGSTFSVEGVPRVT